MSMSADGMFVYADLSIRLLIGSHLEWISKANVEMAKYSSFKDNGYITVSRTLLRWFTELKEREIQGTSVSTRESMHTG